MARQGGHEALELSDEEQRRIDLVLTDLHMPGFRGYDVTTEWRTQHSARALPIVALTAGACEENHERCQSFGMGKSIFAHIHDASGRIQVYFKKDAIGEEGFSFVKKDVHAGDFIGVSGAMFKTRTGETTIAVSSVTLLAKARRDCGRAMLAREMTAG